MKQPPEWPLMAGEMASAPSPRPIEQPASDEPTEDCAEPTEDCAEPTAAQPFVGTAQVPVPPVSRVPRPPVGIAAAPAPPPETRVVPIEPVPTPPPTPALVPGPPPPIPWSTSGPPARVVSGPPGRVVSGPPGRGSGVAARLPFPGAFVDRPPSSVATSTAPPAAPAWPVKGLVIFLAIVVVVLTLGLIGYLWALPVYDQTHRTLAVPSELVGLPKVTNPAAYAQSRDLVTMMHDAGATQPVVVIYAATDDPAHVVLFAGGIHPVWTGVGRDLGVAFQGVISGLGAARATPVDPGPLGGVARCASGHAASSLPITVCGWQDHGTIAFLLFSNRTTQEGAVLLRAMRPALEHRTG